MNTLFGNSANKTVSLEKLFSVTVLPERVIDNKGCTKHIARVSVNINWLAPNAFTYIMRNFKPKTFIGTATLHVGDTKNTLVGHDIAEHKAMAKAFNYINKELHALNNYFMTVINSNIIGKYANKAAKKRNKQYAAIERMVKE